jgi:hypothetical protein
MKISTARDKYSPSYSFEWVVNVAYERKRRFLTDPMRLQPVVTISDMRRLEDSDYRRAARSYQVVASAVLYTTR